MTITIKNYAKDKGISEQAVRRQVSRLQKKNKEFASHIVTSGNARMLDDWAVDYLNQHRRSNEVVYVENTDNEIIKQLKQENEELLKENKEVYKALAAANAQTAELALKINVLEVNQARLTSTIEAESKRGFFSRLFHRAELPKLEEMSESDPKEKR